MTKITIELDDGLLQRMAVASGARNLSIEDWLRAQAEQAVGTADVLEVENEAHRALVSALNRPEGHYDSPRDELNDRERDRAETYVAARAALLELIDNTEGDMGAQRWSRRALYES